LKKNHFLNEIAIIDDLNSTEKIMEKTKYLNFIKEKNRVLV
jgi:hypothetical protein